MTKMIFINNFKRFEYIYSLEYINDTVSPGQFRLTKLYLLGLCEAIINKSTLMIDKILGQTNSYLAFIAGCLNLIGFIFESRPR